MSSVLSLCLLFVLIFSVCGLLIKEDLTTFGSKVPLHSSETHEAVKLTEKKEELSTKTNSSRIPGNISKDVCVRYTQQLINKAYEIRRNGYPNYRHERPYFELHDHIEGLPLTMATKNVPQNPATQGNYPPTAIIIAGGERATLQEFLHMALLGYQNDINSDIQWNCGGSLISENFILTAAHCVTGRTVPPKYVRLGITLQSDHSSLQELKVNETIVYPEYTPKAKYHDIALLRLSENVNFTRGVYPACLHTTKGISRRKATATGWGYTEFLGPGSNHLMKVELDFFSKENCTAKYTNEINKPKGSLRSGILDDLMICAGSNEEIRNTCQGDSGGPLSYRVTIAEDRSLKMHYIVGVTSFGRACSLQKGIPGIYTRVSNYVKWIEDNVWPKKTDVCS